METFSALLAIYAGNSPVTCEFLAQRPVTRSFDGFFDLRLNKRSSKQSLGWWFEPPLCSLWRHYNALWRQANVPLEAGHGSTRSLRLQSGLVANLSPGVHEIDREPRTLDAFRLGRGDVLVCGNDNDQWFNSLWPSGVIWRQRSGSTLTQVMACCLTAPSHYLNQCWLIISEVNWHSY